MRKYFWWSLWSLAWGSFWGTLSYALISVYFQPGFERPPDVNGDGDETPGIGLVWSDWWPVTLILAIGSLWLGMHLMKCWVLNQDADLDWVDDAIEAILDG